jgi:hypothetical protein
MNKGSPSDSSRSQPASSSGNPRSAAAAARARTASRSRVSRGTTIEAGSPSTAAANATPRSSRSSGRHVSTMSIGCAARRWASQMRASRDASSAHWASSTTTRPGTGPAAKAASPVAIACSSPARRAGTSQFASTAAGRSAARPNSVGSGISRSSSTSVAAGSVRRSSAPPGLARPTRRSSMIDP